jgi:hypothetical protein
MDRWQLLPARQSTPKVARLARTLADVGKIRNAAAVDARRDMTIRILLWPIDREVVNAAKLVSDCESVLRGTGAVAGRADPVQTAAVDQSVTSTLPLSVADSATSLVPAPLFPGGGLPLEVVEIPDLPRADAVPPDYSLASDGAVTQPGQSLAARAAISTGALPDPSSVSDPAEFSAPAPVPQHDPQTSFAGLADRLVMERLQAEDPRIVQAATTELQRRGFQSRDVELARRLVDPDSQVRLELVDALPQVPGIDTRRWLLWLCRDRDPLVRKAAVTVVATANDPSIRDALQELEKVESDPGVLRLVRSVLYPNRTR